MASVSCPRCSGSFDSANPAATGSALLVGAATGAYFGSGVGIALGPLGAIAGTIPGAIIGGVILGLGASKVACCIHCKHQFVL